MSMPRHLVHETPRCMMAGLVAFRIVAAGTSGHDDD